MAPDLNAAQLAPLLVKPPALGSSGQVVKLSNNARFPQAIVRLACRLSNLTHVEALLAKLRDVSARNNGSRHGNWILAPHN